MTAFAPCRFAAVNAASISLTATGCDDMQLPAQCPRRPLRSVALIHIRLSQYGFFLLHLTSFSYICLELGKGRSDIA